MQPTASKARELVECSGYHWFSSVEGRCKEGKAIQFSVAHLEFREETFPFSEKGDMFSYFAVGIDDRSGVE
jgi:hypothetical protein